MVLFNTELYARGRRRPLDLKIGLAAVPKALVIWNLYQEVALHDMDEWQDSDLGTRTIVPCHY